MLPSLLLPLLLVTAARGQASLMEVDTKAGRVMGKRMQLTNGKEVAAFLGVFFAEPPVGDLRFKAPVPRAPWEGTYNATTFGPLCAQSKNRSHWDIVDQPDGKRILRRLGLWDYPQGEDCLNLNIYVPMEALPENNSQTKPLSVMFFIHGGSYKTNGGRFYPGEWLASAGQVIVVTVNYRLGVLGFLSTEDEHARGNYGLLDQILALQWVKENIAAFGGNASDVTIFGNSAGGACVGLHLISPMSKGLFTKAIAQSGSPMGEWAVQRKPRVYVERLARKFKCPNDTDSEEILDCLRQIDVEEIIEKSEDAKTLEDSLMLQFAPVADGEFLLQHPSALLQQEGALEPGSVMVGVTRDELEDYLLLAYQDKDPATIPFTKDLLRKYLVHLVRKDFMSGLTADVLLHAVYTEYVYRHGTPSHHKRRRQQQQSSSNATTSGESTASVLPDIRTLGKIISDIDLKAPSVKLVNLLSLHPNMSVYMYEFDYASTDDVIANKYVGAKNTWVARSLVETCAQEMTQFMKDSSFEELLRTCKYIFPHGTEKRAIEVGSYHESELYYIFGFPHLNLSNALRLPQDREVSNIMIQLWTDFAKYGNPTPSTSESQTSPAKNFTWRQFTQDEDCFATLGLQPFVARSYESEKMTFWNHFIPLLTEYPILISRNTSEGNSWLNEYFKEECFPTFIALSVITGVVLVALFFLFCCIACSCPKKRGFRFIGKIPIPV